jgi:hypothetical protein
MSTIELIRKLQAEKKMARDSFYRHPVNREAYGNKDKKPEEFKDKTFLYIRSTDIDNGGRPLPAGTVFWNSPDIELYDSSGTLIPTNQLALNQNYTITVLVHNEGDMACNSCIVELFICNPTIGFDRAHATQIGIQTLSVQGHNTVMAKFNFTPGNDNLGHQCLFARAYSYVSADMPNSADQFYPTTDSHIGQQNLSIVSQDTTFEFMVFIADKLETQNLTLKLKQNKAPIKNHKLKVLSNLLTTDRTISGNHFLFMKNIGSDKKFTVIQNMGIKPSEKNFLMRLLIFILSFFIKKRFDTTRYEEMKPVGNNTWTKEFSGGPNKVTLEIPYMFLGKNKATQFEIEMINEKMGVSLGGLTIIVKG